MGIADEIQRLDELRRQGTLTDDEFARAKTQLLAPSPSQATSDNRLEQQLAAVRQQNELARIDREWEMARRGYEVTSRNGVRSAPKLGMGIVWQFLSGLFGILWIALALILTGSLAVLGIENPVLSLIGILLPLFGILWALTSFGTAIYQAIIASRYNSAFTAYQTRRRQCENEASTYPGQEQLKSES